MTEQNLNYWEKPNRVPVFVVNGQVCYQPDYLTPKALAYWYQQVSELVRDGIVNWYE